MADYYTQASFVIDLETPENMALANAAIDTFSSLIDEEITLEDIQDPDLRNCAKTMELTEWACLGFDCEQYDATKLWFHEDESLNVDQVCEFLFYLVTKCDLKPVGFTWASICSKARLDAFDGGAACITQEGVTFINSSQWLRDQLGTAP